MVTILGIRSSIKSDELKYVIDVATANIPGSADPNPIFSKRSIKAENLTNLFKLIDSKKIFNFPQTVAEKDIKTSSMIFVERWSKDPAVLEVVIRDFFENRSLDEMMLMMYLLAWSPDQ